MESLSILLVDDDTEFLSSVRMGLEARGFAVEIAEGGSQALLLLETLTPDVIVTDLRMQPMNGFDLYQNVKKIPRLSNIRFFFLTGMKDRLAEKFGRTLGAEAYFVKPIDLVELEKAIYKAVGRQLP